MCVGDYCHHYDVIWRRNAMPLSYTRTPVKTYLASPESGMVNNERGQRKEQEENLRQAWVICGKHGNNYKSKGRNKLSYEILNMHKNDWGKTLSSTRLIQWDPEIQDRFSEILQHKTGQARSLNTKMPKVKPYQT